MCTFAKHNLCKDPPFSNLDLVSCRNVLIYLDAAMQRRVLPLFHYALYPGGFLTLGSAETIGAFDDLFTLADKAHKIYAKVASARRPPLDLTLTEPAVESPATVDTLRDEPPPRELDVFKEADRVILQAYSPAGVLINEQMDILQFRGDTSRYLRPAPGRASFNLMKMGREGLLVALRTALEEAKQTGGPVSRAGVQLPYEGQWLNVTLRVMPLKHPPPPAAHYVVLFEESVRLSHPRATAPAASVAEAVCGLEQPSKDCRPIGSRNRLRPADCARSSRRLSSICSRSSNSTKRPMRSSERQRGDPLGQ